jgi:hypothetical protein
MNALLAELTSHLERVVEQKDVLVGYLQQPFTGDSLAVEYESQRFVQQTVALIFEPSSDHCRSRFDCRHFQMLFKTMADEISALPTRIAAIEWATKFSLQDGLLVRGSIAYLHLAFALQKLTIAF